MNKSSSEAVSHPNLRAYSDSENLRRFTAESFKSYCDAKLDGCSEEVSLIKEYCLDNNWAGKVYEIGSGNSKLLYRLEIDGLLGKGVGIEVSKTRYEFAEKFREYVDSERVTNINDDFLNVGAEFEADIVIAVDIVFHLISAMYERAEDDALKWIYNALRPEGCILLELKDYSGILNELKLSAEKEIRIREDFPETDPFEYVLRTVSRDHSANVIVKNVFFKRDSPERSETVTAARPYTKEEISSLLEQGGFGEIRYHSAKNDNVYFLTARKLCNA